MNGFIRVALYARVSSQKQVNDMTIQSQRQAIIDRINKDKMQLHSSFEFCDEGYSGAELLRPALETLRDRIACSVVDRVYILSPDRLSRRLAHQALLLEEFDKHQCEIIFLNQAGLPDSPEANLLIQMQGMIAEYEREKILERTRRGRRYSAAAGNVSVFAGAPYGYRYISKHAGDGKARWEIDPDESVVVQLMFDLVGKQGLSQAAVCRELFSRGIRTKTNNRLWSPGTLNGILNNSAYCGEAKYGKKRLIPRKPGKRPRRGVPPIPRQAKVAVKTSPEEQVTILVPALVSKSLFEKVGQQMKENRKRQRTRQEGAKYLLSGLVLCGECGSAYCARRHKEGGIGRYCCLGTDTYRRGGKTICANKSVKGHQLENRVWEELCRLLKNPQWQRCEAF